MRYCVRAGQASGWYRVGPICQMPHVGDEPLFGEKEQTWINKRIIFRGSCHSLVNL
jgi:hypothetical protein